MRWPNGSQEHSGYYRLILAPWATGSSALLRPRTQSSAQHKVGPKLARQLCAQLPSQLCAHNYGANFGPQMQHPALQPSLVVLRPPEELRFQWLQKLVSTAWLILRAER